jgi:hypothetical protein
VRATNVNIVPTAAMLFSIEIIVVVSATTIKTVDAIISLTIGIMLLEA